MDPGHLRRRGSGGSRLRRLSGTAAPAFGLVVVGLLCQEVGASLAVLLFPEVGPLGMVMLRLVFSTVILMLIAGPKLRGTPAPRGAPSCGWASPWP